MRRLGFLVSVSMLLACSDDGVAADGDSQTKGDDGGTADDDAATDPTSADPSTLTDPGEDTQSDSNDDAPGSSDGPAGTTTGTGDGASTDTSASADGSSSDTGNPPADACVTLADCVVIDDCCRCVAISEDEEPPECDIEACLQSTCNAIGVPPVAACELGSCELAPVPCDPFYVACDGLPPDCEDGFLPAVDPDSSCWTGTCVPAEVCDVVPACSDCPDDESCVEYSTQLGPRYHCSPVPASCDGDPSCACMAEACVSPFDSCGDGPMGISCSCPVCG